MGITRSGIVALFAWLGTACGGGEPRWGGIITDSAGVTMVANPAEGIWGEADRWTVEEELRIGVVEGNPDYQFGDVWGLAVDSRGRIFVLDFQAQHIKVFSPEGEYQQTIGRRGGGPGELLGAVSVLMGPGDTLLVPDNRALRFNRYAPDGSSAGSFRIEIEERRPELFKTTASGAIAEQFEPRASRAEAGIENPNGGILRLATDGTVIDTLLTFPSTTPRGADGRPIRGARIYFPTMSWDLNDDLELVCGVNDEYRITMYSGRQLERIITKPFERRPVSDSEREAIRERFSAWAEQVGAVRARADRMWSNTHIAAFYPAFQALAVGPNGTIWARHVQRVSEFSESDFNNLISIGSNAGAQEWDVFDTEGRFVGVVTLPQRFTPMVFRGDKIYGVWSDELDVQYVVRLRVVGDLGVGAT
jgi:hypothetical protein